MLCVAVVLGCEGEPDSDVRAPQLLASDSAGVAIVEVTGEAWTEGRGWTVDPVPVLDIGSSGMGEDYDLFRVRSALRLPDGRIVVANTGTSEIRFYDSAGQYLRAVGGPGEGPGEFESLFSVRLAGDTLFAHDFMQARVSRFDLEGEFLSDVALERDAGLPLQVFPAPGGFVGLLLDFGDELPADATYMRRAARYVRYGRDGSMGEEIDELAGEEVVVRGQANDEFVTMSMASPLMGHRQHETMLGGRLIAATTDRFELRVYDAAGLLSRLIRSPGRDQRVSRGEWDAVVEETIDEREGTPEARRAVLDLAEAAPMPEHRPAHGRMVADSEGYLWLEPYRPSEGESVPWLVVDPAGPILGSVALPHGFRPMDIGRDYVLGLARDETDVEHLRLLTLVR